MAAPEDKALACAPEAQNTNLILRPISSVGELIAARKETADLIAKNLKEGRDFGLIPGVDKPSLFQPGAEQVNAWFGVRPVFTIVEKEIDHASVNEWVKQKWAKAAKPDQAVCDEMRAAGTGKFRKGKGGDWEWFVRTDERGTATGVYRYVVSCELIHRSSGEIIGQAVASCSSLESKYCDRPRESENTVLQMSQKRSYVRVTRNTYGLSDRFTQDVEDFLAGGDHNGNGDQGKDQGGKKEEKRTSTAGSSSGTNAGDVAGANIARGIVQRVFAKAEKKPWSVYVGADERSAEKYTTFSDTVGKAAANLKGADVVITWNPEGEGGKYRTLMTIAAAPAEAAAAERSPEDEAFDRELVEKGL